MGRSEGSTVEAMDRELLAQIPIFGGLSEPVLARIVSAARLLHVSAGDHVIEEGDLTVGVFVVCDGELEICKRGRNGAEFCLAVIKRGDCVGEMSLIDVQARSATVRAIGPATLFILDQ